MSRTESRDCPTCGSKTIPIVYGMPWNPEVWEQVERGEVELGGCVISFDDPSRVCRGSEPHYWRVGEDGALAAVAEGRE